MSAPRTGMTGMDTMMGAMKVRADKIDALVAKMRAASGDAKIDTIVELLTAMTEQHTMCGEMMRLHGMHEMPMHDHATQSREGHAPAK